MKRILQFAVLIMASLLCVFAVSGCSADASKARHLSKAKTYLAAADYDKAEVEFINVLQMEERNPDAMAGLGLIYFEQGRVERVYTFLSLARDLQPTNIDVRSKLA